jgi:hypothetical protein
MNPFPNPFKVTPFDQDPQPQTQPGQKPVMPSTLPQTQPVNPDNRQRDRQRLRMAVAGLQRIAPQDAGSPLGAFASVFNSGAQGYASRKMDKFNG